MLLFAGERFWTVQNTSIRGGGQGLQSATFMLATRTEMRKHMLLHSCPVCVCVCVCVCACRAIASYFKGNVEVYIPYIVYL